jgi:hypothetical protein
VPSSCTLITSWAGVMNEGQYANTATFELTQADALTSTTQPTDFISFEAIWKYGTTATNITIPGTRNLANEGTYSTCKFCATIQKGCTTSCTQQFLARSGSLNISAATRATPGTFVGSLTNGCFEEWNLDTDQPVQGGSCIVVQSASVNASF